MYITSKLDPDEDGGGRMDIVVFPLPCPECSSQDWPEGIQDGVAERVLSEKSMELWVSRIHIYSGSHLVFLITVLKHRRKLLDSQPRFFCPNPRCSVLIQVDEHPDNPEGECPACKQLFCVPCRSIWHDGKRVHVWFVHLKLNE